MTPSDLDRLTLVVATAYNLDCDLLRAQIQVESSGDPCAFRYEVAYFERYVQDKPQVPGAKYGPLAACSYGLLQILLETALEQGFDDRPERLFEPRVGLAWGAKYLQFCLQRASGNYHAALARYNGVGAAATAYADRVFKLAGRSA